MEIKIPRDKNIPREWCTHGTEIKKVARPTPALQIHIKLSESLSTNTFSLYRFKKITWALHPELQTDNSPISENPKSSLFT